MEFLLFQEAEKMKDQNETKEHLIKQLRKMRERVAELEASEAQRKRAEEESKTLARLATRLAGTASVERMISVVREETDHLLAWDAHYFAVRRPEEDTFHVVSFVDTVDGEKKTFPKQDWPAANLSPPLHRLLDGRPVLMNRTPGDQRPALTRFGDKDRVSASLVHVPVRSGDNIIGISTPHSYTPERYNEADLQKVLVGGKAQP